MRSNFTSQQPHLLILVFLLLGSTILPPGAWAEYSAGDFEFFQEASTVTGSVISEDGDPLVGVTILVKGTTMGTVSDIDGRYSLEVENPEEAILVFSYTGYQPAEIPVNNRTEIDLTMYVGVAALEEVVVVGYGTQKKVNLTGAVSSISSEALENRPIASVGQGLQGLVPNLNVTIRNGDPTQGANFNIRGYESINGGSPLVLVDGVPMALERVNPNDIESVNVLKDASAAAVYGARAAFGVILVETKRGKSGRTNISLSTEISAAKPVDTKNWLKHNLKYLLMLL